MNRILLSVLGLTALVLLATPVSALDSETIRTELLKASKITDSLLRLQAYDKVVQAMNETASTSKSLATAWVFTKKEDKLNNSVTYTFSASPSNGSANNIVVRYTVSKIPGGSNAQVLLPQIYILSNFITAVRIGYAPDASGIVMQEDFSIDRKLVGLVPPNKTAFLEFLTSRERAVITFKNPINGNEDTLDFGVFGLKNTFQMNKLNYDDFLALLQQ